MEFLWSNSLILLLAVPLLLAGYIYAQRHRARYALRYSSLMIARDALVTRPSWRRHIPPFLFLLAVSVMVLAMARPYTTVLNPKDGSTIILTIDTSASMSSEDIKPNRMAAAKAAALAFVDQPNSMWRIGIVAFSDAAMIIQQPTMDRTKIARAIKSLSPDGSTAIGRGILASLDAIFGQPTILPPLGNQPGPNQPAFAPLLPGGPATAVVVLLTDGQNVTGPSPIDAAQEAVRRGVRIFTIGVGVGDVSTARINAPPSFRTELDEVTLRKISQISDGKYFRASDESVLNDIYRNLNTQIVFEKEQKELTAEFAAGSIVLNLLAAGFGLAWSNRLP